MEIITGISIAIGGILLVILLRSLTTFFHEMGHALPALLFTQGQVEVFVGSYGDLNHALQLELGRLKLYLKWNPFDWKLGMCRHSGGMVIWQQLITILGGPLASTLIAAAALFMLSKEGVSDVWLGLAAVFAGAALIDLFFNLAGSNEGIQMYDGAITYSDGGQLRQLFRVMGLPEAYFDAQDDLLQGRHQEALDKCQQLLEEGNHKAPIYELCWEALEKQEDYEVIIALYHDFKAQHRLKFQDYLRLAKAYQQLGQLEEAHKYYDHCSYLNYTNATPRYEKGRILMEQGYFGPALDELQLSNNLQADHQGTLALMAACHLHFNNLLACEEALINARTLDPTLENAAVNYYWGLFQEKRGNDKEALAALQRASELGFQHHGLPMKMDDLERAIERKS
jgi:hypothetical protein